MSQTNKVDMMDGVKTSKKKGGKKGRKVNRNRAKCAKYQQTRDLQNHQKRVDSDQNRARKIDKGTRVMFRTKIGDQIETVIGTVMSMSTARTARNQGLITSKRSGTILAIQILDEDHQDKLVHKHKSLVKVVE